MLNNLKTLVMGALFIGGLVSGSGLFSLWNKYVAKPVLVRQIVKQQQIACLERTRAVAQDAKRNEAARQAAAANEVRRAFETQVAARRAAHAAAEHQFEQDISDYEEKLKQAGRSCTLDGDTIDWLRGIPRQPNPRPG